MKAHCVLCNATTEHATEFRSSTTTEALIRCNTCDLVRLDDIPETEELKSFYQGTYYEPERASRFLTPIEKIIQYFRSLRTVDILRWKPGPAGILDVGCGRGLLIGQFRNRGWRAIGTQLSETAARVARDRGLEVITGELPELDLPPSGFRVITFYHVFEHLVQPRSYLRACHNLLENDGLLLIEVPNFASPGFRFLGLKNLCVDYPHHVYFFTPATIGQLLQEEGFSIEKISHFSLEYSPITTLQNILNLLPGRANRFLDALRVTNGEGPALLKNPYTWLHFLLAGTLSLPALLISLCALGFPIGNTIRLYCRKMPKHS